MNIHKSTVFLLIIMAVLVVPIFYFVRWANDLFGTLACLVFYIGFILVLRGILYKTGFKFPQSENRTVNRV